MTRFDPENVCYASQAAVAGMASIVFIPMLAALAGLIDENDASGFVEVMTMMLALPSIVVFLIFAFSSLGSLVRGPGRARYRLLLWIVAGPGLFIAAVRLDPSRMNSFSPLSDTLMMVSLISGCALPFLWLLHRGPA